MHNIGVHFFDMLSWIFGKPKYNAVHLKRDNTSAGYIEFENARVRWFLSIDFETIPTKIKATGQRTYRSITINDQELEFSEGFTELHTKSYEHILSGDGFGLDAARRSIDIVHHIRTSEEKPISNEMHPLAQKVT